MKMTKPTKGAIHEKKKKKRAKAARPPAPSLELLRSAELVPATYFHLLEPAFTQDSLRWHLFQRDHNGLVDSGAVVRIGRRILIVPDRFRAWARAGGSSPAATGPKK